MRDAPIKPIKAYDGRYDGRMCAYRSSKAGTIGDAVEAISLKDAMAAFGCSDELDMMVCVDGGWRWVI